MHPYGAKTRSKRTRFGGDGRPVTEVAQWSSVESGACWWGRSDCGCVDSVVRWTVVFCPVGVRGGDEDGGDVVMVGMIWWCGCGEMAAKVLSRVAAFVVASGAAGAWPCPSGTAKIKVIIKRADERECDPLELSAEFCQEFLTDMADLQCLPPTVQPRVSDHMDVRGDPEQRHKTFLRSFIDRAFLLQRLQPTSITLSTCQLAFPIAVLEHKYIKLICTGYLDDTSSTRS
ncbi:cysteine--tRNA ligase 2, cytoplasmic [Tanacetum coccineum]